MNFLEQYVLVVSQKDGDVLISPVYTYSENKNIYFDLIFDYQNDKTVYLPWEKRSIKTTQIQTIKFLPCNEHLDTPTVQNRLKRKALTELTKYGELFGETDEHKLVELERNLQKNKKRGIFYENY